MSFQGVSPTVDGMLGGFAFLSPVDVDGSTEFLKEFLEVCVSHLGKQGHVRDVMNPSRIVTLQDATRK